MNLHFIEVTQNSEFNWGKFAVGRFTQEEWEQRSTMTGVEGGTRLLFRLGWTMDNLFVLDLQTGEGAIFRPGGSASADLDKHAVWVCPMFEPFLTWLYQQDLTDLEKLPRLVKLDNADAPAAIAGYRRQGPLRDLLGKELPHPDEL